MHRTHLTALLVAALVGGLISHAIGEQMILKWKGAQNDPHPCLYLTAKDVGQLRKTRPDLAATKPPQGWHLARSGLDELIVAAVIGGNPDAEKTVIEQALKALDGLIGQIPRTTEKNVGPHAYAKLAGQAAGLADAALAAKSISAEQRAHLVGRIARACYMLDAPNYWNPKTGKCSLCPNMTTSARGYRLAMAALIPSHPKAKTWFDTALKELKQELDDWTDPNGGMIECPHYSMVIYDQWVGAFLIAQNAGAPEGGHLFDPQLRQAIEWFGNLSTPRDCRSGNFRRWPSLGHTYANERTSMFGVMACLYKDKDPGFAAEMEWMHREHGSFGEPGILSYYPALMGYRSLFRSSGVQPKAPAWGSMVYPETGALLRNTIGSNRETTLHLIAGRNHSHYYDDSGSITIWGKGRELCDEDSYGKERVLAKERGKNIDARGVHSMVDGPATYNPEEVMALREFSASPHFDYVRGTRRGWQRQIGFVKDSDPLGPNYFVIADTFDAKSVPTVWRLYLAAAQMKANGTHVTVTGRDDVDLDIVFLRPRQVKVEAQGNHISITVNASGTLSAVLYPRLRSESSPQVTPLADGRGAKVVTKAGADYVFLDLAPLQFKKGDVAFEGKAGVVKVRKKGPIKSVVGPCDVAPAWEGNRELRMIRWEGPQYPSFPYK